MIDAAALNATALSIVAKGKGILAADESTESIGRRFEKFKIPNNEENRRAYRELLFTTPGMNEYISAVILFDETMYQSTSDGVSFRQFFKDAGVIPGIKVDKGTELMGRSLVEKVTKGLDGLPPRLNEYAQDGAKFTKWRAVIAIGDGTPSDPNIRQNAKDLAAYAKAAQEAGLVPIVEPEVLMDGSHPQVRCKEATEKTHRTVFEEMKNVGVALNGVILKTNMVIPGIQSADKKTPEEIASATVNLLKSVVPEEVPAVVFLSGGQSEQQATENLNAICTIGLGKIVMTFSYGRALQDSALSKWGGNIDNVNAAQRAFLHRAQMNSLALTGAYSKEFEDSQ